MTIAANSTPSKGRLALALVASFACSPAVTSAQESSAEESLRPQSATALSYENRTGDLDAKLERKQRNYTIAGSTLLVGGVGGMFMTVWAANEPENLAAGVAAGVVLGAFFGAAGAAGIALLVRRRQVKKERERLRVTLGPGHVELTGSF